MSAAGTVACSPAGQAVRPDSSDLGSDVEMIEDEPEIERSNGEGPEVEEINSASDIEDEADSNADVVEKSVIVSEKIKDDEEAGDDGEVQLLEDESESVDELPNGQDEDDILRDDEDSVGEIITPKEDEVTRKPKNIDIDDDAIYLDSDEDEPAAIEINKVASINTSQDDVSSLQASIMSKSGITIEAVRGNCAITPNEPPKTIDEDDIMEIQEADPLGDCNDKFENSNSSQNTSNSPASETNDPKTISTTIVVNDTKSLVELAHSKKEPGKEPTLVIIDTNSILSGKGPVPMPKSPSLNNTSQSKHIHHMADSPGMRLTSTLHIPDDAFLIEAPSFIVPYVFEQAGEKTLKAAIKSLADEVRKQKETKIANDEALDETDEISEPKKSTSEDYFESPVGKLLMNVGMNLVTEYVQVDLLKMQKRKADKEKEKSRSSAASLQTQQSIMSLRKNIEESKENNEPFRFPTKKCELCNFKTESELVMSTHLETPHMRNYSYRCNFCVYTTRVPHEILFHMEAEHNVKARLERAPAYHQCPNCAFEDNSKAKLTRHLQGCTKRFRIEKNLEPPLDWDTPAKLPKLPKSRLLPQGALNSAFLAANNVTRNSSGQFVPIQPKFLQGGKMPPLMQAPKSKPLPGLIRTNPKAIQSPIVAPHLQRGIMLQRSTGSISGQLQQAHLQMTNSQILQQVVSGQLSMGGTGQGAVGGFLSKLGLVPSSMGTTASPVHKSASQTSIRTQQQHQPKPTSQPSISITPLPRQSGSPSTSAGSQPKPQGQGTAGGKTSFVICEICDGYIKDLDQLRNHMQWIHKVKIHPKMIYNKPPLNCQKCQFRFFTDQGLERHLLGSHGLVTSSMQDAANKGQDSGRCPLCGKVYQWKLLAHVAKDHNVTLKPAHLSYKCTVCTATFGMYKLFESHVYSAHSMTSKARNDRRPAPPPVNRTNQMQVTSRPMPSNQTQNSFKPLKINDEITIIPQPLANSVPQLRNKGSLTITPQSSTRRMRNNDDDGIQIIEIDDTPHNKPNGRNPKENGEFKGRLPISDSTLRKRNLEISVCGTDSDNNSSDESFLRGPPTKRLRNN